MMMTIIQKTAKNWIPISTIALCISTIPIQALASSYTDYAKVTHVSPIYETITVRKPHRQCHLEERVVRRKENSSITPNIVGALIGGAIGNKLGHNKSNKRVGAVLGAVLGGSIANDIRHNNHNNHHNVTKTERICSTTHSVRHKKEVTGYDVEYKYRGRKYSTTMHSHPGNQIRVAVDVSPIDY